MQLAGTDAEEMGWAAALVESRGADLVDVNFGCPIDHFTRKGMGAALGRQPKRIRRIVEAMKRAVAAVPVTAKIRLGWNDADRNYLEQARAAVDGGADAVIVHGRTRDARYRQSADWEAIGEVAAAVPVPVVGNGDILFPHHISEARARSGCAAVMAGRGVLIKPWLFREAIGGYEDITPDDRLAIYRRYVDLAREHWGEDEHGLTRVREFVAWHLGFWCRYAPRRADRHLARHADARGRRLRPLAARIAPGSRRRGGHRLARRPPGGPRRRGPSRGPGAVRRPRGPLRPRRIGGGIETGPGPFFWMFSTIMKQGGIARVMKKLVLIRHGESTWNKENRFTGWTDVDLSEKGVEEATAGGRALRDEGLRVRRRLHLRAEAGHQDALDCARTDGPDVDPGAQHLAPQRAALRRAAGPQQGRDGRQTRHGADQHLAPELRRAAAGSHARRPAPPEPRSAVRGTLAGGSAADRVPEGHGGALPAVLARDGRAGRASPASGSSSPRTATVSARSSKYLDNIPDADIVGLNIPTGIPLVYELTDDLAPIRSYYLGDPEAVKKAAEAVAAQLKR